MMMRRLFFALALVAAFGLGVVVGQHDPPERARAAFWADACFYWVDTAYITGGGSYTVITAHVADWSRWRNQWTTVSDYAARNAVGSFDCQRRY